MQKKIMVMAFAAIVTLALAMPVAAQTTYTGAGTLSSNTRASTASLFTNDVDNFINYHKYSTVLTDDVKYFGFITGRTTFGGSADLGFATSLSNIYLGFWFRGNIVRQTTNDTETHTITPTYDDVLGVLTRKTESTTYSTEKWLESANNFEFLVGVAGHGIKVGFFESYAVDQNPAVAGRPITVTDTMDGRKVYDDAVIDYQNSQGHLKPYIGWGSNFAVAGMNLMPYVDLAFDIYSENKIDKYESYTTVNGVKQKDLYPYSSWFSGINSGNNYGKLTPDITVGAKLDLAKKNTTVSQLELKYNISLDAYDNDYSASGVSGSAPGPVWWWRGERVANYSDRTESNTYTGLGIYEQTRLDNKITLGYKVTGEPFENFKLGFSAQVPVSFGSSSVNNYEKSINKTVVKYDWDYPAGYTTVDEITTYNSNQETSTFGVDLNLNLGVSYKLKPDRLIINAGIAAIPLRYSRTETKQIPNSVYTIETVKTTQDDGSVTTDTKTVTLKTEDDSVQVQDTWNQWSATLYGGFVFYFSPKATLDLCVAATAGSNRFDLDLSNLNVIFTFKF
jgi:hypothetical protein